MDSKVIEAVQSSFEKVKPISDQAAEIFYSKLFEKDPSLQPLFKGDMKEQGRKLMSTLALAVSSLTKLDSLIPILQDLGKRHVYYGVSAEMYDTVGSALIETLEAGLGKDFTTDVKLAWAEVYYTLADVMKEAAYGVK
ncbi:MAG: globin family protein [Cytophagaceae bacterium]